VATSEPLRDLEDEAAALSVDALLGVTNVEKIW
jgi:hypothetical protein